MGAQGSLFGPFNGDKLRLARQLASRSLDELGAAVGASRQYVHQLETGAKDPAPAMREALAAALRVREFFFAEPLVNPVREDDCHFRRLQTAPRTVLAQAAARGTAVEMLVAALERRVRLPAVDFPELGQPETLDGVEEAAEAARRHWDLGTDGPITSMTRVAENAGAAVVHFADISDRIDALSVSRRRPLIVRSSAKASPARARFDLAHECGHLLMHGGVVTGDHGTEEQAHRFASAFLLPRTAFVREWPRRGGRSLDWTALGALKLRWGVSLRALARRAFDLRLIDAGQYRTANVHLAKTGQARRERGDGDLRPEQPELLAAALDCAEGLPGGLAPLLDELGWTPELFAALTGRAAAPWPENVVPLARAVARGPQSGR